MLLRSSLFAILAYSFICIIVATLNKGRDCGSRLITKSYFKPDSIPLTSVRNVFDDKIFGGAKAEKNSWPWMVLLGKIDSNKHIWVCGGALISDQWILTAAHCMIANIEIARLGEHQIDQEDPEVKREDYRVDKHNSFWFSGYQRAHKIHDIGLIKLLSKVSPQFQPVCLPSVDNTQKDFIGKEGIVTGWGARAYLGELSKVLREARVTVYDMEKCRKAYSKHKAAYDESWPAGMKTENILCAGHPLGDGDACQGDSGGPLVVGDHEKYTIIGVVSNGFGCGDKNYPGIYVPVFEPLYLNWIKEVVFGFKDARPNIAVEIQVVKGCPDSYTKIENFCLRFDGQQKLNWTEAEKYCQKHGGHLASAKNIQESALITNYAVSHGISHFWLGATDHKVEGRFVWHDGTPVQIGASFKWGVNNFILFKRREPNGGREENCLDYNAKHDRGNLGDARCEWLKPPLCKYELSSS